jgi:ADP-ribosylglycohydrolase
VEAAVQAAANKGFDTAKATALLPEGENLFQGGQYDALLGVIARINQALREAPRLVEPTGSPASLEAISNTWPSPSRPAWPDEASYYDKTLGAWLGKNIGGSLGGILEGWPRERILRKHGVIRDYVLKPPPTLNDDISFEIVMLHALEEHGPALSSAQLGIEWVAHLPIDYCYTAEKVALGNMLRGIMPPESGTVDNPFSEWVGAQMKGELCGLIAPGRPDIAARYAYLDGVIAHEREGVYGEIFVAAATSLAFVSQDLAWIVKTALEYVPPESQYAAIIRQAAAWSQESPSWQEACARVEQTYGRTHHWVHVLPNAALVVIALLSGKGDFQETISIATTCGMDVDCNGGVAGAIVGAVVGASQIPARLSKPLGGAIDTWVVGFERLTLKDLASRTCRMGARVREATGS